jgi:hypothetical protein
MSNEKINKYEESLELTNFLKGFCEKYQMCAMVDIICAESVLSLMPKSFNSSTSIQTEYLVKLLLKNNIYYVRYYSSFKIPRYYNYFKVTEKDLEMLNIGKSFNFEQYLRKEKLKRIINDQ